MLGVQEAPGEFKLWLNSSAAIEIMHALVDELMHSYDSKSYNEKTLASILPIYRYVAGVLYVWAWTLAVGSSGREMNDEL